MIFCFISIITIEVAFLGFKYEIFMIDLIANFGSLSIITGCLCYFLFEDVFQIEPEFSQMSLVWQILYFILSFGVSIIFGYYWKLEWNDYYVIILVPMVNILFFLIVFLTNMYLRIQSYKRKNKKKQLEIDKKCKQLRQNAIFTALFLELLLVQLFITMNYGKLYNIYLGQYNMIIFWCSMYPIIIGTMKFLIFIISKKSVIDSEAFIQYISLTYAAVPYRMATLFLTSYKYGMTIIGIKVVYKLLTYIGLPYQDIVKNKLYQMKKIKTAPVPFSIDTHMKQFNYLQFIDSQNNLNFLIIGVFSTKLIQYTKMTGILNDGNYFVFMTQGIVEILVDFFLWLFIPFILRKIYPGFQKKSFLDTFNDELVKNYKMILPTMFLAYVLIFFLLTR